MCNIQTVGMFLLLLVTLQLCLYWHFFVPPLAVQSGNLAVQDSVWRYIWRYKRDFRLIFKILRLIYFHISLFFPLCGDIERMFLYFCCQREGKPWPVRNCDTFSPWMAIFCLYRQIGFVPPSVPPNFLLAVQQECLWLLDLKAFVPRVPPNIKKK